MRVPSSLHICLARLSEAQLRRCAPNPALAHWLTDPLTHPLPACTLAAAPAPPQVLVTQLEAKKHGYSDVVYLDAKTDTYLEEVSSCNIFCVKGKHIKTPPLQGTILPGVTRRCGA